MGEDPRCGSELRAPELADPAARLAVLVQDPQRLAEGALADSGRRGLGDRGVAHPADRPGEVDGRRPRRADAHHELIEHRDGAGGGGRTGFVEAEDDGQRAADADRGGAADRQSPDRIDRCVDGLESEDLARGRELRLVDDLDRVVHPGDGGDRGARGGPGHAQARAAPTPALNALASIMLVITLLALGLAYLVFKIAGRGGRGGEGSAIGQLASLDAGIDAGATK